MLLISRNQDSRTFSPAIRALGDPSVRNTSPGRVDFYCLVADLRRASRNRTGAISKTRTALITGRGPTPVGPWASSASSVLCFNDESILHTSKNSKETLIFNQLRWQLIADRNEWPKPYTIILFAAFFSNLSIWCHWDRNYREVTNLLFILPGLDLNILKTEKISQSWGHKVLVKVYVYVITNSEKNYFMIIL